MKPNWCKTHRIEFTNRCGGCSLEWMRGVTVAPRAKQDTREYMNKLAQEINQINIANGWNPLKPSEWKHDYKVPGVLALIHSEVSEALEAFRKDDHLNFEEELADAVIRVLDCAGGLKIDMDRAIAQKLMKNRKRSYRHGGKRV